MVGIGIDTGGTYTDAVVYNLETNQILASAKSLTTKEDLKVGIRNVLEKLPADALSSCGALSLSTTLATNACVENRGGKGKLVLIGLSRQTLESSYRDYGIESLEDVYLLECELTPKPAKSVQPDWTAFAKALPEFAGDCDCISIVQLFAKEHLGSYEKKAAEIVKSVLNIPVILGHDLFPDRNILRRGAGALLNARLIPVIHEFMTAVKAVFKSHGLSLPVVIMRSDGNLMSDEYTCRHPVETLLCGPAASITGVQHLVSEENAVIVDMGGTTTDIAIIRDGEPLTAKDGIQIGDWKTFVKGLYVDTFALGGDTAVHYNYDGGLFLENYRIMPLCMLAANYPGIASQLEGLVAYPEGHTFPLYEFFVLMKDISGNAQYTEDEHALCEALKNGPLMYTNAAKAIGKDMYGLKTARLEADGVILRSGLTPTDIMHIQGDFTGFDKAASLAGAEFVAHYAHTSLEELCRKVYDMVEEKLYCNLVRILMDTEFQALKNTLSDSQIETLIHISYEQAKSGEEAFFSTRFSTKAILVGVGAPTHIFLSSVACLLGTTAVIPPHASVANAIGAIVGNISATAVAEVKPSYEEEEMNGFHVITPSESVFFEEYEDALKYAKETTKSLAMDIARTQGAIGPLTTSRRIERKEASICASPLLLYELVRTTATGKAI